MLGRLAKNINENANIDYTAYAYAHPPTRPRRSRRRDFADGLGPQSADARFMTTNAHCPTVFDAALPTIDHYGASSPDHGHRAIAGCGVP
jgi:hypothetical protein